MATTITLRSVVKCLSVVCGILIIVNSIVRFATFDLHNVRMYILAVHFM